MSLYKLLGVARSASKQEIKVAYRKLAMQFHPDKHTHSGKQARDAATEKFKRLSAAYDTLLDDYKRAVYDLINPDETEARRRQYQRPNPNHETEAPQRPRRSQYRYQNRPNYKAYAPRERNHHYPNGGFGFAVGGGGGGGGGGGAIDEEMFSIGLMFRLSVQIQVWIWIQLMLREIRKKKIKQIKEATEEDSVEKDKTIGGNGGGAPKKKKTTEEESVEKDKTKGGNEEEKPCFLYIILLFLLHFLCFFHEKTWSK